MKKKTFQAGLSTAKIRNHDGAIEIYLEFNPQKKISNAKGLAFHYEKIVDSDLLITTIRERFYEMKRAPSSVVYTLADGSIVRKNWEYSIFPPTVIW